MKAENREETFVKLFAANERHLRAFVRSTGLGWNEVDEVIQNVSLVMWRKWSEFDPGSDFLAWGRVIARFEVLKVRRSFARDRHVFSEDLMERLADKAEEVRSSDRHREALDRCLEQLPKKSRDFINVAYHSDRSIKDIATALGKTPTAFYKTLDRIRKKLQICIEGRLETGGSL